MDKPKRMKRTRNAGPCLAWLCAAVTLTAGGCGLFGPHEDVMESTPKIRTVPNEAPEWKAKIEAKLKEPISLNFQDSPIANVLASFRTSGNVNLVVDGSSLAGHDRVITFTCRNMPFKNALDFCVRFAGLTYTVRDEAILVCTKERLKEIEARPKPFDLRSKKPEVPGREHAVTDAALNEPVSFDFIATPLDDVVAFFRAYRKLNIIVDRRALANRGDMEITLRLDKVSFKAALGWVCTLLDLNYIISHERICISTSAGIEAILKDSPEHRNDLSVTPEARKAFTEVLDSPVSFDFIATPLDDVTAFFRNLKKVNIVVDKQALKDRDRLDVTLRLDKVPFRDALAWICRLTDLACIVTDGAICFSTPAGVDAIPKNTPAYWNKPSMTPEATKSIEAVLGQPVSFDFIATPIGDVVAFFRILKKVNIVVDKQAVKDSDKIDVTMRLDKIALRDALTWICRLNGLAFVVTEGRVVITTPEAARKLANPQLKPGTKD